MPELCEDYRIIVSRVYALRWSLTCRIYSNKCTRNIYQHTFIIVQKNSFLKGTGSEHSKSDGFHLRSWVFAHPVMFVATCTSKSDLRNMKAYIIQGTFAVKVVLEIHYNV